MHFSAFNQANFANAESVLPSPVSANIPTLHSKPSSSCIGCKHCYIFQVVAEKSLKERQAQKNLLSQQKEQLFKAFLESPDVLSSIDRTAMLPLTIGAAASTGSSCNPEFLSENWQRICRECEERQFRKNKNNKATLLRKREVILSRISIYIVFLFLLCHSLRSVPNAYEMVKTYSSDKDTKNSPFPEWVKMFTQVSHLMVTVSCSANFYIYFAKYGGKLMGRIRENSVFKRPLNSAEGSMNVRRKKRMDMKTNSPKTTVVDLINPAVQNKVVVEPIKMKGKDKKEVDDGGIKVLEEDEVVVEIDVDHVIKNDSN